MKINVIDLFAGCVGHRWISTNGKYKTAVWWVGVPNCSNFKKRLKSKMELYKC
jgi:hypothetical protein